MYIEDVWYEDECGKAVWVVVNLSNKEKVDVIYPNCTLNSTFENHYSYIWELWDKGHVYTDDTEGNSIRALSDDEYNDILVFVDDNLDDYINQTV